MNIIIIGEGHAPNIDWLLIMAGSATVVYKRLWTGQRLAEHQLSTDIPLPSDKITQIEKSIVFGNAPTIENPPHKRFLYLW